MGDEGTQSQLNQEVAAKAKAFCDYVAAALERKIPNPSDEQTIALAGLARATAVAKAGLLLFAGGLEREMGPHTRIMLELAYRLHWLLNDVATRELRMGQFMIQFANDQRRLFEGLKPASGPGADATKVKHFEEQIEKGKDHKTLLIDQFKARYPGVDHKWPSLEAVFKSEQGLPMYEGYYRHLSVQEHSEGWHLREYGLTDENGHMIFWLAEEDPVVEAHLKLIYFYHVLLAQLAVRICDGFFSPEFLARLEEDAAIALQLAGAQPAPSEAVGD